MSNVIHIQDGKLARRRYHNAMTICMWVQRGIIPPRKQEVLKTILFALKQGVI